MKKTTANTAAVSGLSIHNLSAEQLAEALDWRGEVNPPEYLTLRETFSRKGLENVVTEAMAYFAESKYGFNLPYNLSVGAPWWSLPWNRNFSIYSGVKYWIKEKHPDNEHLQKFLQKFEKRCQGNPVEYAARFAGWLKKAGTLECLAKAMRAVTTPKGMNSPYTLVNPFDIFERYHSPGRANKRIWLIKMRSNQILKPYGLSASWESLGCVIANGPQAIGKAAFWAANYTLGQYLARYDGSIYDYEYQPKLMGRFNYLKMAQGLARMQKYPKPVQRWAVGNVISGRFQTIREALQNTSCLKRDSSDGVRIFLDTTTTETVHGIEITRGWASPDSEEEVKFGQHESYYFLRQVATERTYHSHYHEESSLKKYAKEAIAAWRRQAEAEKKKLEAEKEWQRFISFLKGDLGYTVLVYRQDSYDVGNCVPGTRNWLRDQGWDKREFIPASWLVPHLGFWRVKNIATKLYEEFQD